MNCRYYDKQTIEFNPVIIAGMARVGKTLMGNVISTCKNVEYSEEPWGLTDISLSATEGLIDYDFAKNTFLQSAKLLYEETYLLRCVNFRPIDLSYIGNKKTKEEIEYRLNNLKSFRDIKNNKNSLFVINMSERVKELNFIYDALKGCKIIYVIRNALNVASEIKNKQWFSKEQLIHPSLPYLFRVFEGKYYIPYFIKEGDEKFFINLSEYEKGVYYWNIMTERSFESGMLGKSDCMIIRYEDFIEKPKEYYDKICEFIPLECGEFTNERLSQVGNRIMNFKLQESINERLFNWTNENLKKFNYKEIEK